MIQFNELRITPDASRLIIEVQVKEDSYFDNVGITAIVINKINNAKGEYTELLREESFENSIAVEAYNKEGVIKKLRYVLNETQLNNSLSNAYIEVIIETDGDSTSSSPMGYANSIVKASVVDLYPFYIKVLSNIKMLDSLCSNSNQLVDSILRFKALELAFKTGNKELAIQYWFKYVDTLDNNLSRPFLVKNTYD